MGFNADEYLSALTPPSITIGGETYTGKLLSFDELQPFQDRFAQIQADDLSLKEFRDLTGELCEALDLPKDKVLTLPAPAMLAATASFFQSLLGQQGAAELPATRS